MSTPEALNPATKASHRKAIAPRVPYDARILVICDDGLISETLGRMLRTAGFATESTTSVTTGCDYARSGQFPVIFVAPVVADGSWKRLLDVANHYDLGFIIILIATTFTLAEWAEGLEAGAFDVLDSVHELPEAGELARRALWAAYLKGTVASPDLPISPLAA